MNDTSRQGGVSICIVNWNGRELLRRLLESIRAHAGAVAVQVIVVDNGSADGSAEMVAGEYPEVVLVGNSSNRGFAAANNQAAERAEHELLFFVNNDTALRAGALGRLVEAIEGSGFRVQSAGSGFGVQDEGSEFRVQGSGGEGSFAQRSTFDVQRGELNPEPRTLNPIVGVGPRLIGWDGQAQRTVRRLPTFAALLHRILLLRWTGFFRGAYRRYRMGDFDASRSGCVEQLDAAALLVRREAFERAGRWDEGYVFGTEDVDLCARLGQLGEIWYVAEAEMDHAGRVSSRANRPFVYRGYECGYARYVRKHMGVGASLLYKVLVTLDMPLRVAVLGGQYAGHRLTRGRSGAERARERLVAAGSFLLLGLPDLWRA